MSRLIRALDFRYPLQVSARTGWGATRSPKYGRGPAGFGSCQKTERAAEEHGESGSDQLSGASAIRLQNEHDADGT